MKFLTPKDLRNTKRRSGYDHVVMRGDGARSPYVANVYGGKKDKAGRIWQGPRRRTALEAAQDYCDYVNGQGITGAPLPSYPSVKIDMGNTKRHAPKADKVKVIREKYVGPHDVYDVLFLTANGDVVCRKVGKTARGHARYADTCKTFGMSIKPVSQAVTYPSEDAATVAESAKIAEVCKDPKWRRIGKEAFAPVKQPATVSRATKEVKTT